MNENNNMTEKKRVKIRPMTIVGIILCAILLPILVINVTLIIKSYTNKDTIPSVGGVFPLIVLTDSMYPQIERGDLIICRQIDAEDVKVGDVICFFDPMGNGTSTVTHRVVEITETEDGELAFVTKGDFNNTEDLKPAPASKVLGVYTKRIPKAGNVAMFMQTTTGLIVFVVLPLIVLVAIDLIRTRRFNKKHTEDTDALMRELEELRARQAAMSAGASAVTAEAATAPKTDPPQEAPPKEAPPEKSEEELKKELQEMGDPEPMDLDVAPAETGLELGETGEETADEVASTGDEVGSTGDEGGGAGDGDGGGDGGE